MKKEQQSKSQVMTELCPRWDAWSYIPFPADVVGNEINGICLVSLDTFVAGCIQTFVDGNTRLNPERTAMLHRCADDLKAVIPLLPNEAQQYFEELSKLVNLVLTHVRKG